MRIVHCITWRFAFQKIEQELKWSINWNPNTQSTWNQLFSEATTVEKIARLAVLLTFPKCDNQRRPCTELHHILNWLSTVTAPEMNTGRYVLWIFIYRYISTYRFIIWWDKIPLWEINTIEHFSESTLCVSIIYTGSICEC